MVLAMLLGGLRSAEVRGLLLADDPPTCECSACASAGAATTAPEPRPAGLRSLPPLPFTWMTAAPSSVVRMSPMSA